jgi:ABC-type glycerol-3-phosphate transport system substrate-binding protein
VRWSAAAAGLAAATPFLAACQVMPGGGGKEKLNLWLDATFAPPSDDYQTEQINAWAAKNNVEVEITREPGENVLKKLQAGIESKQLPDISQANDARFAQFYPAKIFTDVSDLYQEVGKSWGGYYKPAEQLVTRDGKQWLLPYSLDSNLILYRKDVLEAGGFKEAPKTWDEFFEISQKLQKPPNLYGVGFQFNKAGTDSESTFTLMMYGFGASIVKEDGKTLNIKTPEMMSFANFVKKTWGMGVYPPGVTGWDNAVITPPSRTRRSSSFTTRPVRSSGSAPTSRTCCRRSAWPRFRAARRASSTMPTSAMASRSSTPAATSAATSPRT